MFVDPPSAPSSPYQGLLESRIRGSTFILTEVGGAARSEEARTRCPPDTGSERRRPRFLCGAE